MSLPHLPDYSVLGRLATGGMAEIYRAKALGGALKGREVVLKRLLPQHRGHPAYIELFLAEAKLGVLVVHPNIVQTHDLLHAGRDLFIVQELVGGETVGALVRRAQALGTQLDPVAGLVAVADLLEALRHLHQGAALPGQQAIIHRDVNPENLVVTPQGVAKLIDFGIAETQSSPQRERTGALRGTPAYMSPEQVKARPLDMRSDLFSAGILLWELLAGRPLFAQANEFETLRHICEVGAPPLRDVLPQAPTAFERLLVRALAKERDRRFPTAEEFLGALREACAREGIQLDRATLAAEVRRLAPAPPRL